jgi:hypothetical protein
MVLGADAESDEAAALLWAWRSAIGSLLASLMVSLLVSPKVSPWALRSVMGWASELPRLHRRSPSTLTV